MKKVLLIVLAAALMVFLMSSVARAAGYITPFPTGVNQPHGSYSATTNRCKVCHAVHDAAGSNILLPGYVSGAGASGACLYCHGSASGTTLKPYGSTNYVANYTTDVRWNHSGVGYTAIQNKDAKDSLAATVTPAANTLCAWCHAVHGANAGTISGLSRSSISKLDPAGDGETAGDENAYCDDCHSVDHSNPPDTYDGTSHVQKAGDGTYANQAASYNGLGQVASGNSTYCSGCHSKGKASQSDGVNFPHVALGGASGGTNYGWWQFLVGQTGADYVGYNVNNTSGTPDMANQIYTSTRLDSVCLNCHEDAETPTIFGVGYTF